MLSSHPATRCVDEARAYPILLGRRPDADDDAESGTIRIFKIPRYTEQLDRDRTRDPVYGNGPAFYRGEPVLFCLRDPRDVIASMLTLTEPSGRWVDLHAKALVEFWISDNEFASRWPDEINALRHLVASSGETSAAADTAYCAMLWAYKTSALPELLRNGYCVTPVHYERLVEDPEMSIRPALDAIGLPFDTAVLTHHRARHADLDEQGLAIGGTDPRRAIDRTSIGRGLAAAASWSPSIYDILLPTMTRLAEALSQAGGETPGWAESLRCSAACTPGNRNHGP